MPTVLFKVQGNFEIGLGHVSRCVSLMSGLPSNWNGIFCVNDDPAVIRFLLDRNIDYILENDKVTLARCSVDRVIYDQPSIDLGFLNSIKKRCNCFVCALDYFDYDDPPIDCIINLFNQSDKKCMSAKYLEGLEYAIIPPRFLDYRKSCDKKKDSISRVLVMFGGADLNGYTLQVLLLLHDYTDIDVDVVVGPLNKGRDEILNKAKWLGQKCNVYVDPKNLPEIMSRADVAFSGTSTTLFELGFLRVPSVIFAQNERENSFGRYLSDMKVAILEDSIAKGFEMIQNQRIREEISNNLSVFDGFGITRILKICEIN